MNCLRFIPWIFVIALLLLSPRAGHTEEKTELSVGQTVYVPAYSHIYSGDKEKPFLLTVTLSIRNIEPNEQIKITRIDYYETQGKIIKRYIENPITLQPLESLRYVIPENDRDGGSGANFIVTWEAPRAMNPPIIETIMIGTQMQQGVSFSSRGREIIPSGQR